LGGLADALLDEAVDAADDEDPDDPHAAITPPVPSATPPLIVPSTNVRRDIRLTSVYLLYKCQPVV
jgi:hypothetical protein